MELELAGITKQFPGVLANDNVNLRVAEGEIVALLGENGAGKSTLMNILYGLYTPTSGEVRIDGETMNFTGPGDAIAAGIGRRERHAGKRAHATDGMAGPSTGPQDRP